MIYLLLADGFEEIEALSTLDILRRHGLDVQTVSIMPAQMVTGAHGLRVEADVLFADADLSTAQALVLPGGMPGALHLDAHRGLHDALQQAAAVGTLIAAICAAPMVLGRAGLLRGEQATCYPGFEKHLEGATPRAELVVESGGFITGRGPAAAAAFAFAIAARFVPESTTQRVREEMLFAH